MALSVRVRRRLSPLLKLEDQRQRADFDDSVRRFDLLLRVWEEPRLGKVKSFQNLVALSCPQASFGQTKQLPANVEMLVLEIDNGAGGEDRTPDLRFTKPLHYRCATPAPVDTESGAYSVLARIALTLSA